MDRIAQLRASVKERVSRPRYLHSLGVEETAAALANLHGESEFRARVAGIVHDCARDLPSAALLKLAADFGILVTAADRGNPVLLHSTVGAEIAGRELGVDDEAVLTAVRSHTTGHAGMTVLEQVVFVADVIEPGRSFPGVEEIRVTATRCLRAALVLGLKSRIQYLLIQHLPIHEATIAAWGELTQGPSGVMGP